MRCSLVLSCAQACLVRRKLRAKLGPVPDQPGWLQQRDVTLSCPVLRKLRAELGPGEGVTALLENSQRAAQNGAPACLQVPTLSVDQSGQKSYKFHPWFWYFGGTGVVTRFLDLSTFMYDLESTHPPHVGLVPWLLDGCPSCVASAQHSALPTWLLLPRQDLGCEVAEEQGRVRRYSDRTRQNCWSGTGQGVLVPHQTDNVH